MSNAETNTSTTEGGQTSAITSLSSLTDALTKLGASNTKALIVGQEVIETVLELHSSEQDEQTKSSLKDLKNLVTGYAENTIMFQFHLTNISKQLNAPGKSLSKSLEAIKYEVN